MNVKITFRNYPSKGPLRPLQSFNIKHQLLASIKDQSPRTKETQNSPPKTARTGDNVLPSLVPKVTIVRREPKETVPAISITAADDDAVAAEETKVEKRLKLFISYSWGKGAEMVRAIADVLGQQNYEIRLGIGTNAEGGTADKEMRQGINEADFVIWFFSEDYINSARCRKEVEYACVNGKRTVPVGITHGTNLDLKNWLGRVLNSQPVWIDSTNVEAEVAAKQIMRYIDLHLLHTVEEQEQRPIRRFGKNSSMVGYESQSDDEEVIRLAVKQMIIESTRGTLLITGEQGVGKTTIVSESVACDDNFLRGCGFGTVIWLKVYRLSIDFSVDKFYTELCRTLKIPFNPSDPSSQLVDCLRAFSKDGKILIILDDVLCRDFLPAVAYLGTNIYLVAIARTTEAAELEDEVGRTVTIDPLPVEFIATEMLEILKIKFAMADDKIRTLATLSSGMPLLAKLILEKFNICLQNKSIGADTVFEDLCTRLSFRSIDEKWDDAKKQAAISQLFLLGLDSENPIFLYRYFTFLVFGKGSTVDLDDLAVLWQCNEDEALQQSMDFAERALVRSSYLPHEGKEFLSLHACIYDALVKFAIESQKLTELSFCEKFLQKIKNPEGENIFHLAIRLQRQGVLDALLRTVKDKKSDGALLLDLCGQQAIERETPLHLLFHANWFENAGTPWARNYTFNVLCELFDLMLAKNKTKTVAIAKLRNEKHEDCLSLLVNTVEDDSKWHTNALMVAASNNLPNLALFLLEHGADIDVIDADGNSSLIKAVESSATNVIAVLLEWKKPQVDINLRKDDGRTALMIAAQSGKVQVVGQLLSTGYCNVDERDYKGYSALMWASMNGHVEVAKLLLEHGADLNAKSLCGETAVWKSMVAGCAEAAELLFRHGATLDSDKIDFIVRSGMFPRLKPAIQTSVKLVPINKSINKAVLQFLFADDTGADEFGVFLASVYRGTPNECVHVLKRHRMPAEIKQKALLIAAHCGHKDVVKVLLDYKIDPNGRSDSHWTPLMFAARSGSDAIIELLLRNKADVNAQDREGNTALTIAVKESRQTAVRLLLSYGADVNLANNFGVTPLIAASSRPGKEHVVVMLLSSNADVESRSKDGSTALLAASAKGADNIVKLLVANNASVSARNYDGLTPLMAAAANGHASVVAVLLSHDAQVDCRNKAGYTPLLFASQRGHDEVVRVLLRRNAQLSIREPEGGCTPLMLAAVNGRDIVAKVLLENNANLAEVNKNGDTAMLLAARKGYKMVVKLLMDYGDSVNQRNVKNGYTALMYAVTYRRWGAIRLLLDMGADPNVAEVENFNTPLMVAAQNGFKDVVQMLLDNDADIDARNRKGMSPLMFATLGSHLDIIRLLLDNDPDQTAIVAVW